MPAAKERVVVNAAFSGCAKRDANAANNEQMFKVMIDMFWTLQRLWLVKSV